MWISVKNTLVFAKQLWVTLLKKGLFEMRWPRMAECHCSHGWREGTKKKALADYVVVNQCLSCQIIKFKVLELILFASRAMVLVALTAIYWAIRSWLERNLCFHSAVRANYIKHFA